MLGPKTAHKKDRKVRHHWLDWFIYIEKHEIAEELLESKNYIPCRIGKKWLRIENYLLHPFKQHK